jgi:hypothetical protein
LFGHLPIFRKIKKKSNKKLVDKQPKKKQGILIKGYRRLHINHLTGKALFGWMVCFFSEIIENKFLLIGILIAVTSGAFFLFLEMKEGMLESDLAPVD